MLEENDTEEVAAEVKAIPGNGACWHCCVEAMCSRVEQQEST
jgi:hypothetical protein